MFPKSINNISLVKYKDWKFEVEEVQSQDTVLRSSSKVYKLTRKLRITQRKLTAWYITFKLGFGLVLPLKAVG